MLKPEAGRTVDWSEAPEFGLGRVQRSVDHRRPILQRAQICWGAVNNKKLRWIDLDFEKVSLVSSASSLKVVESSLKHCSDAGSNCCRMWQRQWVVQTVLGELGDITDELLSGTMCQTRTSKGPVQIQVPVLWTCCTFNSSSYFGAFLHNPVTNLRGVEFLWRLDCTAAYALC